MAITKELDLDKQTNIGYMKKKEKNMIVLSQAKDIAINYNELFAIKVEESKIIALGNGTEYCIGSYKSNDRARIVLFDLITTVGNEPMFQLPRE